MLFVGHHIPSRGQQIATTNIGISLSMHRLPADSCPLSPHFSTFTLLTDTFPNKSSTRARATRSKATHRHTTPDSAYTRAGRDI